MTNDGIASLCHLEKKITIQKAIKNELVLCTRKARYELWTSSFFIVFVSFQGLDDLG